MVSWRIKIKTKKIEHISKDSRYLIKKIFAEKGSKIGIVVATVLLLPLMEVFQLIIFTNLTATLVSENPNPQDVSFLIRPWINIFSDFSISIVPAISILLGIFAVVLLLMGLGASYIRSRIGYSIKALIQNLIFSHQINNTWSQHSLSDRSLQFQAIKEEPTRFASGVLIPILEGSAQIFVGIAIIIFSAITIPTLTLMSVTLFGVLFIAVHYFTSHKLEFFNLQAHQLGTKTFRRMLNTLDAFKETKLYGLEDNVLKSFDKDLRVLTRAATFQSTLGKASKYLLEATAFITLSVTIALTFIFKLNNGDMLNSLAIFAICTLKLVPVFNALFGSYAMIKSNKSSYSILNDLLQAGNINRQNLNLKLKEINEFKKFKFKDVSFALGKTKIFENLTFELEAGKSYGIVGPSGSGKTTLIDLFMTIHQIDSGNVFINDLDIDGIDLDSWKRKIGLVMQDVHLFNGTMRENIVFSLEDNISKDQDEYLWEICKKVSLDSVLSNREGLDTIVGDQGIQLSGGQKQRLGIARALYRKASILVFDEATSALDSRTEESILQTINNLKNQNLTMIQIAHRIQTLKNTDSILIIDQGKVIDSGSYEELSMRSTIFKELKGL